MSRTNPTGQPLTQPANGLSTTEEPSDQERLEFQTAWDSSDSDGDSLDKPTSTPPSSAVISRVSVIQRYSLALHRGHQQWIAVALVFVLLAMAIYFGLVAKQANGLVEIETAPRLKFDFKVDVNRAKWFELFAIPGVGETLAKRIVEYRNQNGEFSSIDELEAVRGLGPTSVQKMAPYLLPLENLDR